MLIDIVTLEIMNFIVAFLIIFIIFELARRKLQLTNKLLTVMMLLLAVWMIAIILMNYVPPGNMRALFILDAITCCAVAFMSICMVLMSLVFATNITKLPRKYKMLFIAPVITSLIVITNPLHHMFYKVFSVYADQVQFGPLFLISGASLYICSLASIIITLNYGCRSTNKQHLKQAILFSAGIIAPVLVNLMATLKVFELSIAATPLSFIITIAFDAIAIYVYDFMNIKPVALQSILDGISDCFVILGPDSLVVSSNNPFDEVFGQFSGIRSNVRLRDLRGQGDNIARDVVYNLYTSFELCISSNSAISYEQATLTEQGKRYYAVELTPLMIKSRLSGVIAMFKDVTTLKLEMQREQADLSRTMERERLASLGQMIGGISHNLKTPIMAISGSTGALEALAKEYIKSVGDPEITLGDHKEIYQDMTEWHQKILECCAYMSDIITTVKDLSTNMNTSDVREFTMDDLCKRVLLLMRHSLTRGRCTLKISNQLPDNVKLRGDINNLVQVLNNLVENAIDAMNDNNGEIILRCRSDEENVLISVTDRGKGIAPNIREKLFKEMYTSKGAMGTGLGLFISNALIRGKFDGRMWHEDNPEGGSIFNVSIPLNPDSDSGALPEPEQVAKRA